MDESEIFLAARRLTPSERPRFLAEACGLDERLRADVEALLVVDVRGDAGTNASPVSHAEAQVVANETLFAGRYAIREQIGEGGMGLVYLADQVTPVQRRVAIKVVRSQLATRSTLARFEQERQALALMNHPNIATVFDAGVATFPGPSGNANQEAPYFVLELIQGVPITKYCDDNNLSPRQRLQLFVPVCQAIQHAHQKGIIHRDLKPSNILVGLYNDQPVPKVIDFGVAKATEQKLTDRSIVTEVGSLIGTLEYMSPEQADLNNVDIDTRTDIYALGVILYELLTGSVPFSRKELESAGLGEMLRMIKEVEPPRPSTRLSASHLQTQIAAHRHIEPRRLTHLLQGDLDCIVMKALEKERSQRYDSADGLAADVERFLADEPVHARPPSAGYRLHKFIRKHRGKVLAAVLLVGVLVCGIVGTTWGLIQADAQRAVRAEGNAAKALAASAAERHAKERAQDAEKLSALRLKQIDAEKQATQEQAAIVVAVNDFFLNDVIRQASSLRQMEFKDEVEPELKVKDALHRAASRMEGKFKGQEGMEASVRQALGAALIAVGDYAPAIEQLERAYALRTARGSRDTDALPAAALLAEAYLARGKHAEALAHFQAVLDTRRRVHGQDHRLTRVATNDLAVAYLQAGRTSEAKRLFEGLCKVEVEEGGPDHPEALRALHHLGCVHDELNDLDTAITFFEKARAGQLKHLGPHHPYTLVTLSRLGDAYLRKREFQTAHALLTQARAGKVKTYGPEHPSTLATLNSLALAHMNLRQLDQAIRLWEEVRSVQTAKSGIQHKNTLITLSNLASAYLQARQFAQGASLFEQVHALNAKSLGADHADTLTALQGWAAARYQLGDFAQGARLFEQLRDARIQTAGPDHVSTLEAIQELAICLREQDQFPLALALMEQVHADLVRTLGPDDHHCFTCLVELSVCHLEAGEHQRALELLQSTLKRVRGQSQRAPLANLMSSTMIDCHERMGQFEMAERLRRSRLEKIRQHSGADSSPSAIEQAYLAANLLKQKRYADAEPLLRHSISLFTSGRTPLEAKSPSRQDWELGYARSLLGEALARQKQFAAAEPLLVQGFEDMKRHQFAMPVRLRLRQLDLAVERLFDLYVAWGKPDQAAAWQSLSARSKNTPHP